MLWKEVIDPELGIDICQFRSCLLRSILTVKLEQPSLIWPLTTMGCPLADLLTDQIHDVLAEVEEVTSVDVKLVWYLLGRLKKWAAMHGLHLELVKHSIHQNKSEVGGFPNLWFVYICIFEHPFSKFLANFSDKVAIIKRTRYNSINRK